MTDYSGAINDLKFFENRLKNILEVIPVLSELGSLDNAVAEAKRQIDTLKADIDSLVKDKIDAENALTEAQRVLDNRKADFDSWLEAETKASKSAAETLLKDAQDKANSIVALAAAKADNIAKDSEENKIVLSDLLDKISTANKQYEDIQNKLKSIKASL